MARAKGSGPSPILWFVIALAVVVIAGSAVYVAVVQQTAVDVAVEEAEAVAVGVPVQSLVVNSRNSETFTQESGDDVELWILGSDVSSPQDVGLLDTIDLTSGTATSTASTEYRSSDNQNTRDLYFEGTGNYYDEKISNWMIAYNEETDKGTLMVDGESHILITDIGTWKDMDTADTLGTSFADGGTDNFDYNVTDGTGTSSIKWSVGNSEADSEIREPVLCVGDADGDLEGDELTGLTIVRDSGQQVASLDAVNDILQLFTESAGTGGDRCIAIGDVVPESTTGVYEIEFQWAEANFEASEELEISFDDLGNANERQYPSGNVKAVKETVTIDRVA